MMEKENSGVGLPGSAPCLHPWLATIESLRILNNCLSHFPHKRSEDDNSAFPLWLLQVLNVQTEHLAKVNIKPSRPSKAIPQYTLKYRIKSLDWVFAMILLSRSLHSPRCFPIILCVLSSVYSFYFIALWKEHLTWDLPF